jgi:hypothetical protein
MPGERRHVESMLRLQEVSSVIPIMVACMLQLGIAAEKQEHYPIVGASMVDLVWQPCSQTRILLVKPVH